MAPPFELASAVVKVGDGRGFIVGGAHGRRLVATAAHCLPRFPPCHSASYIEDRTYANLIGQLRDAAPTVWAECLFVDPIADIAVLGSPDNQALFEQADAYDALMESSPRITDRRTVDVDDGASGWLLTLDGRWAKCVVHAHPLALWIESVPRESAAECPGHRFSMAPALPSASSPSPQVAWIPTPTRAGTKPETNKLPAGVATA